MPNNNKKQPLQIQLKNHWSEAVMNIPKTRNRPGDYDCFKDRDQLINRLQTFAAGLEGYTAKVDPSYQKSQLFWFKKKQHLQLVTLQLHPKPFKERSLLELKLTFNLDTRKSYLFFNSKIGMPSRNFVYLQSDEIKNLDLDATLTALQEFIQKVPEYKQGAEKIAEDIRLEKMKHHKITEMASKSIETVVPQMMASSDYEWNLEREYRQIGTGGYPERYLLRIKTKKHRMVEISLTPKNFSEKIPEILNVMSQIEDLLEKMPYAVNILSYGPNIRWQKE